MNNNKQTVLKKLPEPLMFIQTIGTPLLDTNIQIHYDSQKKVAKSKIKIKEDNKLIDKLSKITIMYQRNRPIFCSIILKNESVDGYPKSINNNQLSIITKQNNTELVIDINNIIDVVILSTSN